MVHQNPLFITMKSKRFFSGRTPEERGKQAEEAFFKAWEGRPLPKWMVAVARPTREEDLFEKTDAVIVAIDRPPIRVQVKSFYPQKTLIQECHEAGVALVWVCASDSEQRIRGKTHKAIHDLTVFLRQSVHVLPEHQKIKKGLSPSFYRRGTRYKKNPRKRELLQQQDK